MGNYRTSKAVKPNLGRCGACWRRAVVRYDCRTCADTSHLPHSVAACRQHASAALSRMKRHALTRHPVNIVRAAAAALAGEDIE